MILNVILDESFDRACVGIFYLNTVLTWLIDTQRRWPNNIRHFENVARISSSVYELSLSVGLA